MAYVRINGELDIKVKEIVYAGIHGLSASLVYSFSCSDDHREDRQHEILHYNRTYFQLKALLALVLYKD